MVETAEPTYLAFVKVDLICKEFERQFHEFCDEHVREWTRREGCSHGWRTREMRGAANDGLLEQEFWNIYRVNDPRMFSPIPPTPRPTEKNPWLRDHSNWGRVFYRIISHAAKHQRPARCWARFEMNFNGTPEEEQAFRQDYASHIKAMIGLPGIQRVWQLEAISHDLALGPAPAGKYMCLYEMNALENVFDPDLGTEILPFEGRGSVQLVPAARHFAKVLLDAPSN